MYEEKVRTIIEKVFMAVVCLCICLALYKHVVDGFDRTSKSAEELSSGWYYLADGKKVPLLLPASVEEAGPSLTIYNDRNLHEFERGTLLIKGMQYRPTVEFGDMLLYEYDDSRFERTEQMAKKLEGVVQLPANVEDKKLAITYHDSKDGSYQIPKVYIGSSEATFRKQLLDDGFGLCITFVMLVMGVIAICINTYLGRGHMADKRFKDVAILVILSGIWGLADTSFIQYLFGYAPIIYYFSIYALMLIPIPLLCFARHTDNLKEYKVINWGPAVFFANFVIQSALEYAGVLKFSQMMAVTHCLMSVGILILNGCLIMEYRQNKTENIRQLFIAAATVGAGGLTSFVLYWIVKADHYELAFLTSIMVFLMVSLYRVVVSVADSIFNRTEAEVYVRLSKRDGLTGMNNIQMFHEYVSGIETGDEELNDAALVFIRLQNLRELNDQYGHNIGDEVIIAAGRCVEEAYQDLGHCFRLSNGEFCAVLPETDETESEIRRRLEVQLQHHNMGGRYKIRAAVGISYLQNADGMRQSVSDWKFEADQKMKIDEKNEGECGEESIL